MVDTFIEIDTAGNGNKSLDAGDFVNNPQLWAWLQASNLEKIFIYKKTLTHRHFIVCSRGH